jgi:fatty acid desaturase
VWAAFTGPATQRAIRATVAVLAAAYVALLTLALTGAINDATRYAVAQGIAPLVWLIVWTAPAIHVTVDHHRNLAALRSLIDKVEVP